MSYIKTLKLNKIKKYAKECIYKKLLDGTYTAKITIYDKQSNRWYIIDVEFKDNDCCLSSWTLNFYTRTQKAVKHERYKTLGICLSQLKKLSNKLKINITSSLRIYRKINYLKFDGIGYESFNQNIFSIEL